MKDMQDKNSLEDYSDDALEAELERRKTIKNIPKMFQHIDFQPLISFIEGTVRKVAEEGYPGKDLKQYVFETAVECMYPSESFWKWWRENAHY
jgi:hypothetical protein